MVSSWLTRELAPAREIESSEEDLLHFLFYSSDKAVGPKASLEKKRLFRLPGHSSSLKEDGQELKRESEGSPLLLLTEDFTHQQKVQQKLRRDRMMLEDSLASSCRESFYYNLGLQV